MDEMKLSEDRLAVLRKIEEYERQGRFDEDVEDDPEAPELLPEKVDYLCKKLSSKISRKIANFIGDRYFLDLIKKDVLVIDGVTGEEHLSALQNGAIVTCNHFSAFDNYIVFHCIRKALPKKYLYKIIREGNYTNFPGLYGFLFRHCNTLPLSRNRRTMINFMSAVNTLLKQGESILIYPEQGMWWNYKKPRPFKVGGFKMAYRAGVPVLPTFITMTDDERLDGSGYPIQRHTLHIMPPIYPDPSLGEKRGAEKMMEEAYACCKAKYEEVYGIPLVYTTEKEEE
ncbi:MAG: 1-acyl-sn-glycerol-3-phosphate acyltransferase [Clostridia bacterium]|nr:1-acyl-sn-glycerol-3-phosphate acyltransferase [Clostridia bacterium]